MASAQSQLKEYKRKRDFHKTSEPAGKSSRHRSTKKGLAFVVQKHDASHLHYDFRLEWDGVLKSWAVPQGPCLDPSLKRLAVQVEDHPLEYGTFEGIIPPGQYGGGTVIVWDNGTWEPLGDAAEGLRNGKLKFHLHGEKLTGGWTLVRMRRKPGEKKDNWLLIKERDDAARPLKERDIVKDEPASVLSGVTIGEMAEEPPAEWNSEGPKTGRKSRPTSKTTRSKPAAKPRTAAKSRTSGDKFPKSIQPELATLVEAPPAGDDWLHEIKLDGYRVVAFVHKDKVQLKTRNDLDWSHRFPEIAQDLQRRFHGEDLVFDGEVCAVDDEGVTRFGMLQEALSDSQTDGLVYYVFDLLWRDGTDLRGKSLEVRKDQLAELLGNRPHGRILYSDHQVGQGDKLFRKAADMGLEGIVSKRRDQPYLSGRGGNWVKSKISQQDEFVIGGFTDSTSATRRLGALLIGYHDNGEFKYAGKVGTGFTEAMTADLRERLVTRESDESPFADRVTGAGRGVHWVDPNLVAQIGFTQWTRDGRLRHPVFQGLREDKPARSVKRDIPKEAPAMEEAPRKTKSSPGGERKPANGTARKAPARRRPTQHHSGPELSAADQKQLEQLHLTHPEKVLYPAEGITKLDLVEFYAAVAEWMLPHIENRPLSLVRCPDGVGGPRFFQKHAAGGTPDALKRIPIREKDETEDYLYIDSLAGLLSTCQMGTLEIHPWGSRCDDIEKPDRLIFDIDPDEGLAWSKVVGAAREVRDRLQDLGLESFLKVTGGKGLHVVAPIVRRGEWPEIKAFTRGFVRQMAADDPRAYTTNMSKSERRGKIFLDYLRNDRGATAVAPYSTRARDEASVAVPIAWTQLTPQMRSNHFTMKNLTTTLARRRTDPWEEMLTLRQSLTAAMRKSVEET
ncbi:DNA ligase D [Planctomyces sp. SH-PL14]|uniref:DNA ligase D n=1 Tax=Planctomyces sp. SH-PL14 TaxID=1632864 RepID=UPI00078DD491|nr:DNA ligase D [Planctomyces sp. SH-PL14]AMV20612.1 Putative DNA ligase-like protein [Planctomyces sp. SH-PL14]